MWWVWAAMIASKVVGNVLQSKSQNKQIEAQNKAQYAQNRRMLVQAGMEATQAYAQAGSLASQATGLEAEAGRLAQQQGGEQAAAAAASGTIGASVDAVQMDIRRQEQVRRATVAEDLSTQLSNLRSRADSAFLSAVNNMGTGQNVQSGSSIWGNALLSAGASTAATYASYRLGKSG